MSRALWDALDSLRTALCCPVLLLSPLGRDAHVLEARTAHGRLAAEACLGQETAALLHDRPDARLERRRWPDIAGALPVAEDAHEDPIGVEKA